MNNDRPLSELKLRAVFVLRLSAEIREDFVGISRTKSPSAAFDLATIAARVHGMDSMETIAVAKATRWLAMIRRDHGDKVFEQVVA